MVGIPEHSRPYVCRITYLCLKNNRQNMAGRIIDMEDTSHGNSVNSTLPK